MNKFISSAIPNGLVSKTGYVTSADQIVFKDNDGNIMYTLPEALDQLNGSIPTVVQYALSDVVKRSYNENESLVLNWYGGATINSRYSGSGANCKLQLNPANQVLIEYAKSNNSRNIILSLSGVSLNYLEGGNTNSLSINSDGLAYNHNKVLTEDDYTVTINGTTYKRYDNITISGGGDPVNLSSYYTKNEVDNYFQSKLVSNTNIKTINGQSILGSGNIAIESNAIQNLAGSGSATIALIKAGNNQSYLSNIRLNENVISINGTTGSITLDTNGINLQAGNSGAPNAKVTINGSNVATQAFVAGSIAGKQDLLESGTNIKSINSQSILGEGNLNINTYDIITLNSISELRAALIEIEGLSWYIKKFIIPYSTDSTYKRMVTVTNMDMAPGGKMTVEGLIEWMSGDFVESQNYNKYLFPSISPYDAALISSSAS